MVVGKILTRAPHPDSDHMSVCTVDTGSSTLQIVCGAPNCDPGNVVPVATIGTVFHTPEGDFKIKKSKLRGIESQGMMCSEKELGLSDNHDGLMLLAADTELGLPVETLFPGTPGLRSKSRRTVPTGFRGGASRAMSPACSAPRRSCRR